MSWRGYRSGAAGNNWWKTRRAVDDDYVFSLSDAFRSGTVNHALWSAGGKQVFSPAKRYTEWFEWWVLAEGRIISSASHCAVWSEPILLSGLCQSLLKPCSFWPFVKDEFMLGKLMRWWDGSQRAGPRSVMRNYWLLNNQKKIQSVLKWIYLHVRLLKLRKRVWSLKQKFDIL